MNNDMIDDNQSADVDDIEDDMEQVMEEEIAINALSMTQNENKRIELAKLHILQNVVMYLQTLSVWSRTQILFSLYYSLYAFTSVM